ncbi:hypothetical protein FRC02_004388 [Tulasnella sp. 418]|nr:hypothetical protein FRC02_004388 [Tulasnella sp. 418]
MTSISSEIDKDPDGADPILILAHRTLFIPEFLIALFDNLPRSDIISSTLVCKTWNKWATSASWSVHPVSFMQLLKVLRVQMPTPRQGIGSSSFRRYSLPIITIPNDVTRDEWNRFLQAIRYIRRLDGCSIRQRKELAEGLENLKQLYEDEGEVAPNIRKITGFDCSELSWKVLPHLFFSRSLRSIEISEPYGLPRNLVDQTSPVHINIGLTTLQEMAPNIQNIYIAAAGLAFSSFGSFKNLTTFQYHGYIHITSLQSVLQCPCLQRLTFTSFKVLVSPPNRWPDQALLLHDSLSELRLEPDFFNNETQEVTEEFFRRLSLPQLRRISFGNTHRGCQHIVTYMEIFSFRTPEVSELNLLTYEPVSHMALSCLSGFPCLKRVTINQRDSAEVRVSDVELRQWIQEMPRLEILEFNMPQHGGDQDYLQLGHLLALANPSSKLGELQLPLNLVDFADQIKQNKAEQCDSLSARGIGFSSLQFLTLKIFNISAPDVTVLAQILETITPYDIDLFIEVVQQPTGDKTDEEQWAENADLENQLFEVLEALWMKDKPSSGYDESD